MRIDSLETTKLLGSTVWGWGLCEASLKILDTIALASLACEESKIFFKKMGDVAFECFEVYFKAQKNINRKPNSYVRNRMKIIDKLRQKIRQETTKSEKPKGNPLPESKLETGRVIAQASRKDANIIREWRAMLEHMGLKITDRVLEIATRDLQQGIGNPTPQRVIIPQMQQQPSQQQKIEENDRIIVLTNAMAEMAKDYGRRIRELEAQHTAEIIGYQKELRQIEAKKKSEAQPRPMAR